MPVLNFWLPQEALSLGGSRKASLTLLPIAGGKRPQVLA